MYRSIFVAITTIFLCACAKNTEFSEAAVSCSDNGFRTKKVVLVVIDGPRLSETWEHPEQKYIPFQAKRLKKKCVVAREFYNLGNTFTIPGHIALTTGSYEFKTNDGSEYPDGPSLFQLFLKCTQYSPEQAYIITSKVKLNVLGNCENLALRNSFRPSMYTKERTDVETYRAAVQIWKKNNPR